MVLTTDRPGRPSLFGVMPGSAKDNAKDVVPAVSPCVVHMLLHPDNLAAGRPLAPMLEGVHEGGTTPGWRPYEIRATPRHVQRKLPR